MTLLKLITFLNWVAIGILAFIAAALAIFPSRGGDAATKGMGEGILMLAATAMLVLLTLNLLPGKWGKYTAFALVMAPTAWLLLGPSWQKFKNRLGNAIEYTKPIFEDPERNRIARAIRDGKPSKLKKLLQTPPSRLNEGGELLAFAVSTATDAYRPKEKLECVRMLFEAGARLDSTMSPDENPIHIVVAFAGNAELLRLLLEQGADANALHYYYHRPVLFEAIDSYGQPEATVRALLEYGAKVDVHAEFFDEQGPIPPLLRAAQMRRWGVCATLIEHGADPGFIAADGTSLHTFVQGAEAGDGFAAEEGFERLKELLKR
jgi:hypothetical protein